MKEPGPAASFATFEEPTALLSVFEEQKARLVADLRALVEQESPSEDAGRVSALAAWVTNELQARGVSARTIPCPPHGDAVLAGAACDPPRKDLGALLLGHLDTVWPAGSLAEMPFRVDDGGRASGPGVFDMKAGIVVAMNALVRIAGRAPASLLLVSDEEIGTTACRSLLHEIALRHRAALVAEPSLDGAVKVARKGAGTFHVAFEGRAAHAGLDPERGASSLLELARFALYATALTNGVAGTTITPTIARSGTAMNVVPEAARLVVDARAWTSEEASRLEAALRRYQPADARVRVTIQGGFDRPPLEDNAGTRALLEKAVAIAQSLGFALPSARAGGASDGNLTAAAGVPTLDGLGPRGGGAHARDEYVEVEDLPRRAALLAALASRL